MPPTAIPEDSSLKGFYDFVAEELKTDDSCNNKDTYNDLSPDIMVDSPSCQIEERDGLASLKIEVSNLTKSVRQLSQNNLRLERQLRDFESEREDLWEAYDMLERDLMQFMQYNRRENIEIIGIPDSIPDNQIEEYVVTLLSRIGVQNLSHYDIVGCHRLYNRKSTASNVIVRFLNHKHAKETFSCKRNCFQLPEYRNIRIVENLCPRIKSIFEECLKLKNNNSIRHLWTRNGAIFFKKSDSYSEKPKKVIHMNDLDYYFPNPSL